MLCIAGDTKARAFSDRELLGLGWIDALPLWEVWVAVSTPVFWVAPRLPRWIDVGVLTAYYYLVSCVVVTVGVMVWRGLRSQES